MYHGRINPVVSQGTRARARRIKQRSAVTFIVHWSIGSICTFSSRVPIPDAGR